MANITLNSWSLIDLTSFPDPDDESAFDSIDGQIDALFDSDPDVFTSTLIQGHSGTWSYKILGTNLTSEAARITSVSASSGSNALQFTGNLGLNGGTVTSESITLDGLHFSLTGSLKFDGNFDNVGGTIKSMSFSQNGYSATISGSMTPDIDGDPTGGTVAAITFQDPAGHKFVVSGISMDFNTVDDLTNTDMGHSDLTDLFNALNLSGNDVITSGSGDDSFSGGAGDDTLNGGAGDDTLNGDLGDDRLDGGKGNDHLNGGDGDDTYIVDIIKSGTGAGAIVVLQDTVTENANEGNDTINLRGSIITLVTPTTLTLGDDIENLNASATTTTKLNLTGNALNNILIGNAAANILIGNDGNDSLVGGAGNDTLDGGNDNDTLNGGASADVMKGGAGNDTYVLDNANDVIDEESNTDTGDTVQASFSIDLTLPKYANIENIILTGTAALKGIGDEADNAITGNAGANILDGGLGSDAMNGGKGNDTYFVDNPGDTVTESFAGAVGGTDTVNSSVTFVLDTNIERLTLTGIGNIDGTGNPLNNIITGNTGNNHLSGDAGNDMLSGGLGNDTLDGGLGIDILKGGTGDDTYIVDLKTIGLGTKAVASLQDTVTEAANAGNDILELRGSAVLTKASTIVLGANIENLDASHTASTLLNLTGNSLNNTLTGNDTNNILNGGAGNDVLIGGDGDDTLIGGAGTDNLTGGSGADVFDFNVKTESSVGAGHDVITDFNSADFDKIDLSTIDANSMMAGNQAFAFIGIDTAFTNVAGQLGFDSVTHILSGDVNGDGVSDFEIALTGVATLANSDFIL